MVFKINPGELKHKIIIQRAIDGYDDDNIPMKIWNDLFKPRAKVLNVRGDEFFQTQGEVTKIGKTFYIRANRQYELSNKDRVCYKGVIYNILYANDIEELGRYIELRCEVVN